MIKVSVLYHKEAGKPFDIAYYCQTHLPMVRRLLGAACTNIAAEQGVAGMIPGSEPTYIAMGHLYFKTVADFQSSFGPQAEAILGDIPNYTTTAFTVQISEVKM